MDGILVINKPEGMTSFDVIARLRKKYGQKKFGHAGTLDPMASGVLVILAGSATKLLPFLKDTDKEYIAELELGTSYDTDDVFGKAEATAPVNSDFDFAAVLHEFEGKQHQLVPKASAKKVNGKKLYEYLRAGQPVPEVYSDVEIYSIEPLEAAGDCPYRFKIACSSGTYIRSICRDFGTKTGNLAAMKSLIRTKANGFTIEDAQPLDAEMHTLYPAERLLGYERIEAFDTDSLPPQKDQTDRTPKPYVCYDDIRNGRKVRIDAKGDQVLIVYKDQPLAIYSRIEEGKPAFASKRGLWS